MAVVMHVPIIWKKSVVLNLLPLPVFIHLVYNKPQILKREIDVNFLYLTKVIFFYSTYKCTFIMPFASYLLDHDQAEKVSLTVYCAQESKVGPLSSHKFLYLLETEQIIAKLLADSASDSKLFECLSSLSLISNAVSKEYRDTLDSRITNAFEFLDLSPTWSLFGENGVENFQNENGKSLCVVF